MARKIWIVIIAAVFSFAVSAQDIDKVKLNELQEEKPAYRAYILGDTKGNVFYAENEKEKVPMASVTKIMTMMLTYDALEEGKIKLNDKVTVDKTMATMQGSRIWMKEGTKISVEELMKATALHSANNAAYGLAKVVGGNVDNFVKMMNKKADELGFGNEIKYNTPTGLPPHMTGRGEDVGSALGIYKLSLAALKYPDYIKMASEKEDKLVYLGNAKIYNRNTLLGKEGIYGIKTGHHDNWFNITVASDKDNMNIITVVLGAPTEELRNEKIIEEITLFHSEYKLVDFLNGNIPVSEIEIYNGTEKKLEVYPEKDLRDFAKSDSEVNFIISRKRFVKAPLKAGDSVGEYKLYIDGRLADEGKLLVKQEVKSAEDIFH